MYWNSSLNDIPRFSICLPLVYRHAEVRGEQQNHLHLLIHLPLLLIHSQVFQIITVYFCCNKQQLVDSNTPEQHCKTRLPDSFQDSINSLFVFSFKFVYFCMVQISIRVDTSSNHVYISIASWSPLPGLAENIVFIIKYMDIGDCMFNVV